MPNTPTRLAGPTQPGAGAGTIHTAAGAEIVTEILLANTTAAAATVTIGVNGVAAANQVVPAISVPANSVTALEVSLVLNNTDTLQALQGTVNAITVTVSGLVL